MEGRIPLYKALFARDTKTVFESGALRAEIFTYSTGVEAVRLCNGAGYAILLPFMGQMVWDMAFCGHNGRMKSIYDEPMPCKQTYGESYGCFVMHCGLTAIGNPTAADTHLPHGELPIATYNNAWLAFGEDTRGRYLALSGTYEHKRCYEYNYAFTPECRLYENESVMDVTASFENRKDLPLEYYYLCHINYRPEEGAKLYYTASPANIKAHHEVPEDHPSADATNAYLRRLDADPSIMDTVDGSTQSYAPEIVFTCKYFADRDGVAHTMQLLPDGYAHYVAHRPDELPFGVRWISRTEDEDAMGMVLPATAEHLGRLYCRKQGYARYLKKGERVTYRMQTGILAPEAAAVMAAYIQSLKNDHQ